MSIEVRSVSKRFGDHVALDDVSIEIPNGSLCALLGPSGGGKSTLLRIIAGLETPDAGAVLLNGRDVTRAPERERGIGFVFQHYAAFKHMSVRDNVAFGLAVRKVGKAQRRARADELLELVRLGGLGDRYPSQLSGGQRQRMALARALAVEPEVLLLDEPFGALDAQVRQELRDWLRALHDEVKVTTVFVTHDREEALEVAELVAVLNGGRIEQAGSPDQLYDAPETSFVMGFVGPAVQVAGEWVRPHDIDVLVDPDDDGQQALVEHVARLGFEVRVRATLEDGAPVEVQVTRQQADELELHAGQIVWLRPHRSRSFASAA